MKQETRLENQPFVKPAGRLTIIGAVVTALALGGATIYHLLRFQHSYASPSPNRTVIAPTIKTVAALGHLRPQGQVADLSAPPYGPAGNVVTKLLVKEGDRVSKGQVVAILDGYDSLQAALRQAKEQAKVAQANLAKVKAGAKTGEIAAQKATITRLEADMQGQLTAQEETIARHLAELSNAQIEYQRYQKLFQDGAVSASQLDSKRLTMETAQKQLNEAKVNLNRIEATFQQQIEAAKATEDQIAEIRPTDVQAAQAEIGSAIATVTKAQADLNLAYVRAPRDGQILKIYTRAGEIVNDKGIVALGQTNQMDVVAEVYELDIGKVHIGQRATITSDAFAGKLHGTVIEVGWQVNQQNDLNTDPTADVDRRVVEVKLRLDSTDSQKVSALTNLQVNVVIDRKFAHKNS